jgi:hypothetical protein
MVRTGTPNLLGDDRFPCTEVTVTGQNIPVLSVVLQRKALCFPCTVFLGGIRTAGNLLQ